MTLCNVVDQLHDKHRLSYTGTTEESNLTTLHVRLQKVNHLNTRSKNLFLRRKFFKRRSLTVNRIGALHVELFHTVDRLSDYVQHTTFNLIAGRHHNR